MKTPEDWVVRDTDWNRQPGHCGVRPYGWVDVAEWNDTEYVSVNVACLDNLDPAELIAAPVQYMDGLHDNWWNPPAETRHL